MIAAVLIFGNPASETRFLGGSSGAHGLDEGLAESRTLAGRAIEAPRLGAGQGKREGDRHLVGVEIALGIRRETRDPDGRRANVAHLVVVYLLTHDRAGLVAAHPEGVTVDERKVEVRLLEGETDGREKSTGPVFGFPNGGRLPPEIIRVGVIRKAPVVRRQALQVERTVALFVAERRRQHAPQRPGQFRPAQKGEGEEFNGQQFVVGEARQASRPRGGRYEGAGAGQWLARGDQFEARVARWALGYGDGVGIAAVGDSGPRRGELRREIPRL